MMLRQHTLAGALSCGKRASARSRGTCVQVFNVASVQRGMQDAFNLANLAQSFRAGSALESEFRRVDPRFPSPLMSVEDIRTTTNIEVESLPDFKKKTCVLFCTPDTEELAAKVAAQSGGSITLGKIRWRCGHACFCMPLCLPCWVSDRA